MPQLSAPWLDAAKSAVRASISQWGFSPSAKRELLCVSENATFKVTDLDDRRRLAVRVYRPHYRSLHEVNSELAWISAIRDGAVVPTPSIVSTLDGQQVVEHGVDGQRIRLVAFEWLDGETLESEPPSPDHFQTMGRLTAHLHVHSSHWNDADDLQRPRWDAEAMLGEDALWGDWRKASGLKKAELEVIEAASSAARRRLDDFGIAEGRFGLIHADLRLANLMHTPAGLAIIDFDDCGFGWYGYDFAASLSFIEHHSTASDFLDAWIKGYTSFRELGGVDLDMLPVFVMVRRLMLTAWLNSRAGSDTALRFGRGFAAGTAELSERFLRTGSPLMP